MSEFTDLILAWYDKYGRKLPWRGISDPYAIWVSEIMLQQTRVETVITYFDRWMKQFPTVQVLAEASQQTVLSAWEGLGYYSRGRNLHETAKRIVSEFGGQLPQEVQQLRTLPGIGRYTAAAIASIAFNQNVATLDGNLRRVFARVFDLSIPADSPQGEEILWGLAQRELPPGRAGDYNQALMDLGSGICLPKKPLCLLCPLAGMCKSVANPEIRPILSPKLAIPHRLKMAAIILQDGMSLLALRPSKGLLGGLWEFPAVEVDTETLQTFMVAMATKYSLKIKPVTFLANIRHAYTHFTLSENAWICELLEKAENDSFKWVTLSEMKDYPMGKVDRTIARKILSEEN